jgi:hypothetical protein
MIAAWVFELVGRDERAEPRGIFYFQTLPLMGDRGWANQVVLQESQDPLESSCADLCRASTCSSAQKEHVDGFTSTAMTTKG